MTETTTYAGLLTAVSALKQRAEEVQLQLDLRDWTVTNAKNYSQDSDLPRFVEDRKAYESARKGQITSELADLVTFFEPFSKFPEPATFKGLADQLRPALQELVVGPGGHADFVAMGNIAPNADFDMFTSIDGLIPSWAGIAAQTFKTSFAPKIPAVVWNEFSAVEGLRGPLLGAEELWDNARKDVCKLVDATRAAVEKAAPAVSGGPSASSVLFLISSLIGVAALPFTAGASAGVVAAGFTVATAASAVVASSAAVAEGVTVTISGEKPLDLIAALRRETNSLNTTIWAKEWDLQKSLTDLTDQLGGMVEYRGPKQIPDEDFGPTYDAKLHDSFTMPRPALADTTKDNATDRDHGGRPL
ncbi:hypothetical protein [Nocardioides sp. GXZ039]|uniref:hypothetical protein n=1 Tax=Nocardioides sp. GXZ039 TaxID=3136018 RepID=UPI0030F44554